MPTKIRTDLPTLKKLFYYSASDETLSLAERRLAAQMCVLAAHLQRIELLIVAESASRVASEGELSKHIAGIADHVAGMAKPGDAPALEAKTEGVKDTGEPASESEDDDDNSEEAKIARFLAESANVTDNAPALPVTTPPAPMPAKGRSASVLPVTTPPAPMPAKAAAPPKPQLVKTGEAS